MCVLLQYNRNVKSISQNGGGTGIRTLGTLSRTSVFKTGAFDHSATPPTRFSYTLPSDSKSNNQTKIYSFCRQAFNIESMRLN